MIPTQRITSFSNPKVKYIQSLKDRKYREKESRIFLEGYREISRALEQKKNPKPKVPDFEPEILCISPDCFLGENEWNLIQEMDVPIWEFPRSVFEKMSHRDRPDGLIAIAKLPNYQWNSSILDGIGDEIILVIEGVEKPGNLGTIIRTAEGAGVSMILVTDPRTDVYSPNVIRSSTGILFRIPVFVGERDAMYKDLMSAKFIRFAITPEAKDIYYNEDLTGRIALIFGSEQYGLSQSAKLNADRRLSLPMKGSADSLNLALSCGILIYESLRQRSISKRGYL